MQVQGMLGAATASPLQRAALSGLGLRLVAMWSFPLVHWPHAGASPHLPAAPRLWSPSPGAMGCTQRTEMLQILPVTPHFTLLCLQPVSPQHSTSHLHTLGPSFPLILHCLFAIVPLPGAPGHGHEAGSPGYHLREPRWPPRHAICSATFRDRAGAAVFLGHVSSLPPAAWSCLSVF